MVIYSGKNTFLLFGTETTFNGTVTPTKSIGSINNVNPSFENNLNIINEIGTRESVENIVGNFDYTVGIDGTLNSGAIFELMFRQVTNATTGSDIRHIFIDVSNSQGSGALTLPDTANSFTMSENFNSTTDILLTYGGCKINSIDLSFETGGTLDFSSELMGTSVETSTTVGTKVSNTTKKLSGFQGTLSTGTDSSEATVSNVSSVSVSIGQGIDPSETKAIGSRLNQDLLENNFDVTVDFTKKFATKTEFERFLGGTTPSTSNPTDTSLILDINNSVTLGSGRVEFYLKLEGGQYGSTSHTESESGAVEETFSYTGGTIDILYFVDAITDYF